MKKIFLLAIFCSLAFADINKTMDLRYKKMLKQFSPAKAKLIKTYEVLKGKFYINPKEEMIFRLDSGKKVFLIYVEKGTYKIKEFSKWFLKQ